MICPMCSGRGTVGYYDVDHFVDIECNLCHGNGKVLTNEEWLHTLPADERVKEVLSRGFMTEKRTAEEFVEWLKQPHSIKE